VFDAAIAAGMIASGQEAGFSVPAKIAASSLTAIACAIGSRSSPHTS
jgi:hypothetical protein